MIGFSPFGLILFDRTHVARYERKSEYVPQGKNKAYAVTNRGVEHAVTSHSRSPEKRPEFQFQDRRHQEDIHLFIKK